MLSVPLEKAKFNLRCLLNVAILTSCEICKLHGKAAGLSWSSVSSRFSHPPTIPWVFHTHGWAYNFISPGQARNHHAPPRPAARTLPASKGPALASHWPGPPLSQARTRPAHRTGPHPLPTARPARHAHLHDAQPRFHSTHRIRRRNTAPPQVASDASTLHGAQGPKSPWPGSGPHR